MDRNFFVIILDIKTTGRTPQGCVDRNKHRLFKLIIKARRTPQGCVDRNKWIYRYR